MFRHHPDQIIYINNLQIPLEVFKQLEPNYLLPNNILSREYLPNKYHRLFNEEGQWAGEMPWAEGDIYLAKANQYKIAWDEYQKSLIPPPRPQVDNRSKWNNLTLKNSWTSSNAQYLKLPSDLVILSGLIAKSTKPIAGEIIATLPTGYTPQQACRFVTQGQSTSSRPYFDIDVDGNIIYGNIGIIPQITQNLTLNSIIFYTG